MEPKPSPQASKSHRNTFFGAAIGLIAGIIVGYFTGDLLLWPALGTALGLAFGSGWLVRRMPMRYPPHIVYRILITSVVFFVSFFWAYSFIDSSAAVPIKQLAAVIPIIPGILFIVSIATAIASLDELQRRIQTEAIAIGSGLTAIVALTIGLLGLSGFEQPSWLMVLFTMTLSWLAGKLWTMWKY